MSSTYDSHDEDAGDLYSDVLFGWLMVGVSLVAPALAAAMALREWLSRLWELPAQLSAASELTRPATPHQTEIELAPSLAHGIGNPIRQSV